MERLVFGTLANFGAAVLFVCGLAACVVGPEPEPAAADPCFNYNAFDANAESVTFKTNVLPIFRTSCSGTATECHGSEAGAKGQPYLGPPIKASFPSATQINAIFMQNVGVLATRAKTMMLVEANNPKASFLMHKVDGTLTCGDVKCEAGCGAPMPLNTDRLSDADRTTIRRWIAQGALNN